MGDNIAPLIEELRRAYVELVPLFAEVYGETMKYDTKAKRYINIPPNQRQLNMPMPIITIQRRGRSKANGWYNKKAWHSDAADAMNVLAGQQVHAASTDEIGISAEGLNRSTEDIIISLVGQMIHHAAAHNNGMGRTINASGYQTHRYGQLCEQMGLAANRTPGRGFEPSGYSPWMTTASKRLKEAIEGIGLNEAIFDMFRNEDPTSDNPFKGSKLKKWSCDCTNLRAAVYIEATCRICGKDFVYTDKDLDQMKPALEGQARNMNWRRQHYGVHPGR